jgi:hypothetical protein
MGAGGSVDDHRICTASQCRRPAQLLNGDDMNDLVGEVHASALNHPDAKWPADPMADHELALDTR